VGAWRWLDAVRDRFALPSDASFDQLHPAEDIKPLGELTLAASLAIREDALGSREKHIARSLIDFAWTQLHHGELLFDLISATLVPYPMEIYAWFRRAGYRYPRLDQLLGHLTNLRAARTPEVAAHRVLAASNAARLLGLPQRVNPAALAALTWLGGTPEPWRVDPFILYAMTHTVFHLTDWGARPQQLSANQQSYLHAWLPAWLEVYLEAGQWDLLGELLIVDLCLNAPDHHPHAWHALARAQHPDGLLPAGPERVPHQAAKAFRSHHHPTIVAAIAGTMAVSHHINTWARP
jgi:hypothetical protein